MASPANQDDGVGLTDTDIEQVLDDRAEDNSSAGNSDSGASAQGEGNTPSSANQVFTNVQNVIGTAYDDVLVGDSQRWLAVTVTTFLSRARAKMKLPVVPGVTPLCSKVVLRKPQLPISP